MSTAHGSTPTLIASGYALRIALERGHLLVEDGVGDARRAQRFPRVGHGIKRLVVLGHSGTVTLEALRWLHELGIAFVQFGRDGELIAAGAPNQLRDIRVLRGQAVALHSPHGLTVARDLLVAKVQGQHRVMDRLEGHRKARQLVREALERLADAETLDELRFVESRAAAAYWSAWNDVAIRFAGREAKHVPAHWRTFGGRSSPLTSSPRKATTPGNALLNYLYSILEAEARLAALAVGCDPGLGVIHTDSRNRDSLACDLMEPVRPRVDAYVLSLLESRTFARNDFFEARDGNCRLMPELARPLAATWTNWAKAVAPVAERVAGAFRAMPVGAVSTTSTAAVGAPVRYRTPLTGANYSRPKTPRPEPLPEPLPNRCRGCGAELGAKKRVYCDTCLPKAAREASRKAVTVQRHRRAVGLDGRSTESARAKHRAHTTKQMQEAREWEGRQTAMPSRAVYDRDIAPLLRDVPSEVLAGATGLPVPTCTHLRRGAFRPHARYWEPLERAARAFHRDHPNGLDHRYDPDFFARDIAPHLLELPAPAIQRATGLSISYSRRIRRGEHVPEARHWGALHQLVRRIRIPSAAER